MSIRPIDLNGMIQNTNEVSQMKAREDSKPELQQQNLNVQMERQNQEDASRVKEQENVAKNNLDTENGDGHGYDGGRQKKKKKKKQPSTDGFVKKMNGYESFDIKI